MPGVSFAFERVGRLVIDPPNGVIECEIFVIVYWQGDYTDRLELHLFICAKVPLSEQNSGQDTYIRNLRSCYLHECINETMHRT